MLYIMDPYSCVRGSFVFARVTDRSKHGHTNDRGGKCTCGHIFDVKCKYGKSKGCSLKITLNQLIQN